MNEVKIGHEFRYGDRLCRVKQKQAIGINILSQKTDYTCFRVWNLVLIMYTYIKFKN